MSRFSGSTRGRFATNGRGSRPPRLLGGIAVVAGCLALGCTLAPVTTIPESRTTGYDDCERAARDYCEEVVGARDRAEDECVAKHTFQCVSGKSD
jgi:hypothetical protein